MLLFKYFKKLILFSLIKFSPTQNPFSCLFCQFATVLKWLDPPVILDSVGFFPPSESDALIKFCCDVSATDKDRPSFETTNRIPC